ncbi:MAG: hypothetical protein ACXVPN_13060 [Bacteroidia bacterium]
MKNVRNFIIGNYILKTDNVFEKAKIELLYNFTLFYLLNLVLFQGNLIANGYTYHSAIIAFAMLMLFAILFSFRQQKEFSFIAKILFVQQIITGIISFLIQESRMDFVGEFWIMVNILITFFTLGKKYGFIMSGVWLLQLIHCLFNELSGDKFTFIKMPAGQVLPPAPFFVMVPFFLCIYIIYQFVQTRSIAEHDIQAQKKVIEDKNHEILGSIRYAKRIQSALLPSEKAIERSLEKLKKKN